MLAYKAPVCQKTSEAPVPLAGKYVVFFDAQIFRMMWPARMCSPLSATECDLRVSWALSRHLSTVRRRCSPGPICDRCTLAPVNGGSPSRRSNWR